MTTVEKVCLELWDKLGCTSSSTNKIFDCSVRFKTKTIEVALTTKEDEYVIILVLLEPICSNNQLYYFSKCISDNKYNIESIRIKGFSGIEYGKSNLRQMKLILEKLAEHHAKCMKENDVERNKYNRGYYLVPHIRHEAFLDVLHSIVHEINKDKADQIELIEGSEFIERNYEALLVLPGNYEFVHETNVQHKLFIKPRENAQTDYKLFSVKTGQKIPLIFDLLQNIFYFADQFMRQDQFHNLLNHYYKSLENKLQEIGLDINKILPLPTFERQIYEFTPNAKLEVLKKIILFLHYKKSYKETLYQYKTDIGSSICEVNECILYPNLYREDCCKILKNKMGSIEYTFLNYKLMHLEKREGFLGDYFKLKIEIERNGDVECLHFFAKYLPTYSDLSMELGYESFKKEEFYYLKLIPELNDLGLEEITDFIPKCYFSRSNEVLIFEDLTTMEYKTWDVSEPYNFEMSLMALKQFAKMHACSLIYEEYASEKFKEIVTIDTKYPGYVEEMFLLNFGERHIAKCVQHSVRTILDILDVFPEIAKAFSVKEFKERAKLELDLCFEKVKKSSKYRNVLGHGDAWASNIFFKTDKEGSITDCKIVDYQLIRYCPPMQDIYFFLYMVTTKEVRQKFESKLIQEYYSQLSIILQKYRIDIQKIYTYQQFRDCCSYMKSPGLCHALMVLHFVLFPKDKLEDILKDKEQTERLFYENRDILIRELYCEGQYSQRIRELVEELYEICKGNC